MSDSHDESFSVFTKVQISGVLFKKSFAPHSNKWSKRFFIVKEGFLLYYSESEKKVFDKKGCFNIHPKGVIPVGGCIIQASTELGQDYVIRITSDSFVHGSVALGTETRYDQDRWIQVLQEAARITWENSRMGESIIRDLESQGLQLNKEKQSYVEKLHEETIALRDEIDKNEELEKLNMALDEEKQRLEQMIKEFQKEHEIMKLEYEETIGAMKMVQQDKEALQSTTQSLLNSLSELEEEKKKILQNLHQPKGQHSRTSHSTQNLQVHLQGIEEEQRYLLEEKQEVEERFQENELRAKVLEEEKKIISQNSNQLLSSLNDLLVQQDLPEAELRLEVSARLEAERRLRLAQDSVHHLEGALQTDISPSTLRTKILPDVKKLRKFFEHIAEEARLDANMPVIMKNAVYARKTLAKKARSQMLEQSRQENAKTLGIDLDDIPTSDAPLKRSLSIMISKKSLKPHLTRTTSTRSSNGIAFGNQSKSSDSDGKSPDKENHLPTLEDGDHL
ncbi:pleckstrin homology domain-containing family D member 1 [Cryptotermes secundus]|uniref:pleckstrin homology domain-containing family D member 1 n=1 Tax=Cryptotermes secundus TaxID=105785 RepID=UPI000CD7C321|nr:pleckstrin homology domain-containing family D member 1 [Cryptotermes secundus]